MNEAAVAAIVVTYNSGRHIGPCLDALARSSIPIDVVVVDNGSRDGTAALVRRDHPSVTLIEQENFGYAAGNNRGLEHIGPSRYRYAFIVNPDAVVAPECVERLVRFADERPKTAITCPKIYFADGRTIWFAGSTIDWDDGTTSHLGYGEIDSGGYDAVAPIDRACGAAMLVRMDAVRAVGPMTEDYFLYFEETDWSLRFVAAGYELFYAPDATCRHDASSSTGHGSPLYWYYMTRNCLVFMSRFGRAHWRRFRPAIRRRSWRAVRGWLRRPNRRNLACIVAVSKAHLDFARNRLGKGW
jgi:GT2 family glycosyltransferase